LYAKTLGYFSVLLIDTRSSTSILKNVWHTVFTNLSNKSKIYFMVKISEKELLKAGWVLILLTIQITFCLGQANENSTPKVTENSQATTLAQITTFPQIYTNLNGMVREFVRSMNQDKNGTYWFGTNGDGIIRYAGQKLEKMVVPDVSPNFRVLGIVEDKSGNIWFATSEGLIKYDGETFRTFAKKEGLPGYDQEIWALMIDKNGQIWLGSTGGVCHFDGEKFIPFALPLSNVEKSKPMLSAKLVFKIIEDKSGIIWFVTDGNGVFKYHKGEFTHLSTKNGLTDNSVSGILEDKQGHIWISTFYGGTSRFDGATFTNFTKDGIIKGEETGGLFEDSKGNIWFTAENVGVYKYDGTHFTLYTTENGLTADLVLSIFEDKKGQLWFGTWQGLCIFDGEKFVNAKDKEPWTN
jgi:ligand-binding sensor domain-containing protein